MLPFPAFDSAAITAEKDTVSRCHDFENSVPFGLLQSNNVTTLCSTGSQQGVDVENIVSAVDRCCVNVERAERDLVQPRPRPGGLVFLSGGLSLRPSLFPSKCPPPFTQLSFFRRVGCCTPNMPRLLHHRHFFLLACALRVSLISSFRVPRFPRRRFTNFAHGCRGKRFRFVGLHHHQSMLC